jgi:hypothetical protein
VPEIVPAEHLVVGEVFFDPRRPEYGLRRVNGIRTIRSVETYTVIDYLNVTSGLPGQVNCIREVEVARVQPMSPDHLADTIRDLAPGEHLTLFRIADGVWA